MNPYVPAYSKDHREKQNPPIEVVNMEKQLLALIHSKGPQHSDVRDLYRKVRSVYEKMILDGPDQTEIQDVEYCLWKLHYKHIDEFRKRIKRSSSDTESTEFAKLYNSDSPQRSNGISIEGFKSFISEATDFYQNLISKTKDCHGLQEESLLDRRESVSILVEPRILQKCHFLCHRFLVCLGDLARYHEQYEKHNVQSQNWLVAARSYLEAAMIWPDSGNPHNQMAVLATYVGDEFLALYHCVRSLAVKEPFSDAKDNLILLFERNSSSCSSSVFTEAFFDFSKPSESVGNRTKSQSTAQSSNGDMLEGHQNYSEKSNLWSLLVRMIGSFYVENSLDNFPCDFASALRELEALLALDDIHLKDALESYQHMDFVRIGPFRAIHIVSVFIFIFEDIINSPGQESQNNNGKQLLKLQFAIAATFIFMSRFVERCLRASPSSSCPLLPAVLVFVEYCGSMLDEAEKYCMADEKSLSAVTYFFGGFSNLVNHFKVNKEEAAAETPPALWEDYELRGFAPVADAHVALDFSSYSDHVCNFKNGSEYRTCRIINAAIKIANRSINSQKWLFYDKIERRFYTTDPENYSNMSNARESEYAKVSKRSERFQQENSKTTTELEKQIPNEDTTNHSVNGKSVEVEEEEVILFKPLTRYNSAPLHASMTSKDRNLPGDMREPRLSSDETLRRATSLLIGQNQSQIDSFSFHPDMRHSKPFKQPDSSVRDTTPLFSETTITAGPPSLSAWVLEKGIFGHEKERASNINERSLSPIEEITHTSLSGLSISETEESVSCSSHESREVRNSLHYSPPAPSAPFLPDDAVWFTGIQSSSSHSKNVGDISGADGFYGTSQVSGSSNWSAVGAPVDYGPMNPGFLSRNPPFSGMTSSEWLRQYRETHNIAHPTGHLRPLHTYLPVNPKNLNGHSPLDQWGVPLSPNTAPYAQSPALNPGFLLSYGGDQGRKENMFCDSQYQNTSSYNPRNDPQPLLQYLKEREWRLQWDPPFRGPTYMGN